MEQATLMTTAEQTNEPASQDVQAPVDSNTEQNHVDVAEKMYGDKSEPQESNGNDESSVTENASEQEGAPDKYEFKQEEGKELNSEVLESFSEVAKELNLSQDNAQKLIDAVAPKLAEVQQAAIDKMQKDWAEAAKIDKEFGGDKFNENLALAKTALDRFGSDGLKSLLNETGLGNNPEVIRYFVNVGKQISEDTYVGKGSDMQGGNEKPLTFDEAAQKMYGNN